MYGATKVSGELLCSYYRKRYDIDCRGVRFPGLISAAMPGGGSSDYALFMYVDAVRKGSYDAFARADTRIPLMYMPDGVRALLELGFVERERLTRTIYNIAAFSPRADEIAASVARAVPGVHITYTPDPMRQAILDSWPRALEDRRAREDWGWKPQFELEAMTRDMVPKVRAMIETFSPDTRRALALWTEDQRFDVIATELELDGPERARDLVRAAIARLRASFRDRFPSLVAAT